MTMNKLMIILAIFAIAGCSNKAVYDNIQLNNRNECSKVPPPQYERCMERANQSYDDYERERKEVVGGE